MRLVSYATGSQRDGRVDIRRSRTTGEFRRRRISPQPLSSGQAQHLIDGASTGGKTCVAACKCLQTMIAADETHLDAGVGSVK